MSAVVRAVCVRDVRDDPRDRGSASAFVVVLAVVLLVVAGLVVDAGRAVNARVAVVDDAEQAARVAADQVDPSTLRGDRPPQIDPAAATGAALDFLAARGYATSRADVRADGEAVTVTLRHDVPTSLLRLALIDSFTVEGSATARAALGIRSEIVGGP